MAFDLCAFYMAQIGEASKMLTDSTKTVFNMITSNVTEEIKSRIKYCMNASK